MAKKKSKLGERPVQQVWKVVLADNYRSFGRDEPVEFGEIKTYQGAEIWWGNCVNDFLQTDKSLHDQPHKLFRVFQEFAAAPQIIGLKQTARCFQQGTIHLSGVSSIIINGS